LDTSWLTLFPTNAKVAVRVKKNARGKLSAEKRRRNTLLIRLSVKNAEPVGICALVAPSKTHRAFDGTNQLRPIYQKRALIPIIVWAAKIAFSTVNNAQSITKSACLSVIALWINRPVSVVVAVGRIAPEDVSSCFEARFP